MMRDLRRRGLLVVLALGLVAAACGDGGGGGGGSSETEEPQASESDTGGGGGAITTDQGVTEEACPDAVNPDNGCIYLGVLSDLTVGPFAPLAVPITDGQKAFWNRVNEAGGIGGYDVDIETYTRDNEYNPQTHVAKYQEIEPDILALAQTLGTPTTLAAIEFYKEDLVVGAPASWWSGWGFEDNILESGYNYCIEAMNGIDWAIEELDVTSVQAVGYPGDYGGDSAAGVAKAAEATGIELKASVTTGPNASVGNQDQAVQQVVSAAADLVVIATGPREMAEILGKAVAQGFEGQFLGSVPTWNPALLQDPTMAQLLPQKFHLVTPWGPWGSDTEAHAAMAEAYGDGAPTSDGFTFGWVWSYPMKALLEAAAERGDLTRQGLLDAIEEGVTVDYEGALPEASFGGGGDPNATVVREAIIAQVDDTAATGISVLEDFFAGPTAEAFDFTEPCQAAS